MKKSKNRRQDHGDFNNKPFETLKSFKPDADASREKTVRTPKRKEKADDDTGLFLRAVHGVRTIQRRFENQQDAMKYKTAKPPEEEDTDEQGLFLQAIQEVSDALRNESLRTNEDEPVRRSTSSRIRELKRGTIRLSGELDLHGYVKDEALRRLERFVAEAYRGGHRAVLVITGKGINSVSGPVLQGAVAEWLRGKGRGKVAEFAPAPRNMGGSGALVVFLKGK